MAKSVTQGGDEVVGRATKRAVPGPVEVTMEESASALKSALLALLLDDEDVRDAVRSCLPETTTPVLSVASVEQPDAERARFVVDLIESHIPRCVRPEALRRPFR